MAFYKINRTTQGGNELATAMDHYRAAWYGLAAVIGHLSQMSDAQITEYFGFATDTESAAAKSELQSDIGQLQNGDSGITGDQVTAGQIQMLNQFG